MIACAAALSCLLAPLPSAEAPQASKAPPTCAVRSASASWTNLAVVLPDRPPLAVAAVGLPVAVTPGPTPDTLQVVAEGGLTFTAIASSSGFPLRPARKVALRDGRVELTPDTQLVAGAWSARDLVVTLAADYGVMEGFRFPCEALTVRSDISLPPEEVTPKLRERLVTPGVLRLHSKPEAPDVLTLVLEGYARTTLKRLSVRKGWVRVGVAWTDGTRLTGWVPERDVQPLHGPEGLRGRGMRGRGVGCGRGSSDTYQGPATLKVGGAVHDGIDGPAWARADKEVVLSVLGSDGWVEVTRIPGLRLHKVWCSWDGRAMVRAEDLNYPK